jgi:hypothetical protein
MKNRVSGAFTSTTHVSMNRLIAMSALVLLFGCTTTEEPLRITADQFDAVEATGPDDELVLRGEVERGAPAIVVDMPTLDESVKPPFDVSIRFEANDDASIILDTLKIKYGFFDLTDEVIARMKVSATGISGPIDAVKPGRYKLKVSISDDKKRTGRALLVFRVVD